MVVVLFLMVSGPENLPGDDHRRDRVRSAPMLPRATPTWEGVRVRGTSSTSFGPGPAT
jgi:hypothetical protein